MPVETTEYQKQLEPITIVGLYERIGRECLGNKKAATSIL